MSPGDHVQHGCQANTLSAMSGSGPGTHAFGGDTVTPNRAQKRKIDSVEDKIPKKRAKSGTGTSEARTKGKTDLTKRDINPLKKPVGYEKYNNQYKGYPKGQIERHLSDGARSIAFVTEFQPTLKQGGRIFFGAHGERYGGPYGILSNFDRTPITLWPGTAQEMTFGCVEQAYQWKKATFYVMAEEKFCSIRDEELSSKEMCQKMMQKDWSGLQCSQLGRIFEKNSDEEWQQSWSAAWEKAKMPFLYKAVKAKVTQHQNVKETLMMTGNFELLEATKCSVGIGLRAHEAWQFENFHGSNGLGKILMRIRDEIRLREPEWPEEMAFEYFHEYESYCEQNRDYGKDMEFSEPGVENTRGNKETKTKTKKTKAAERPKVEKDAHWAEVEGYENEWLALVAATRTRSMKLGSC